MRRPIAHIALAALAALLLASCATAATPAPAEPLLALAPCRLSEPGLVATTIVAECGTLAVPENRATPGSRTISLRVVVLPAISRASTSDALFLLAGGPGQAASEAFIPLLPALGQVNEQRDLVLVDQRGTGGSNPLRCPAVEQQSALADAEPEDPAVQAWWRDCLAQLDADPAQYTTASAAQDLDAVRAALGHEHVSLLGVSYGTRVALSYLRSFPERVRVRALVLDGVVPPELAVGATMGRDGQQALGRIFAACANDSACAAAFPALAADFDALLARLGAEAPTVQLADPYTGAPTELGALRLQARGISPSVVPPLALEEADLATPESCAAQLLNVLPYFLIFAVFVGGMGLTIDVTAGERERGSLEPLLLNPLRRSEFVLGKLLAGLAPTMLSLLVALAGFAAVINLNPVGEQLGVRLSLGLATLAVIFLITLPIMLLAAALQMIIATVSRSVKQAQSYLAFLPLIPALPGLCLAFLPLRPALWQMLVPTFGQQVLINQLLRGEPVDPLFVLVSAATTLALGAALTLAATRLFGRERVLFGRGA